MSEWSPEHMDPAAIEARSFEIIAREMGPRGFDEMTDLVVRRVIHATADFDFADNLCFSSQAVLRSVEAFRDGADVVTDTTMVAAGINKRVLSELGGTVHTFIADTDVAEEARRRGVTRSAVSMERAARLEGPLVYAIGNAPTALIALHELLCNGEMAMPEMVIGVPVGFVNVVESKELIMTSAAHYIVARGRKGGSTVAAAIVNALLYMAAQKSIPKEASNPPRGGGWAPCSDSPRSCGTARGVHPRPTPCLTLLMGELWEEG